MRFAKLGLCTHSSCILLTIVFHSDFSDRAISDLYIGCFPESNALSVAIATLRTTVNTATFTSFQMHLTHIDSHFDTFRITQKAAYVVCSASVQFESARRNDAAASLPANINILHPTRLFDI
jgi:hypothetical protein